MNVTQKMIDWLRENDPSCPRVAKDANETTKQLTFGKRIASLLFEGELSAEKLSELQSESEDDMTATASEVFSGRKANGESRVRVKAAGESFDGTKAQATHPKTKMPVFDRDNRPALLPSEFENAKAGALFKRIAQKAGIGVELTDTDRGLLDECFQDDWCGKIGDEWSTKIPGNRIKALLDDSTSGGVEVVPIWFDTNIVVFPLLHGEVYPHVNHVEVPRGRRVEGASVGNPTVAWGNAEGSAMGVFNTAGLVAALDTTIFPVTCAVECGRDFLADSPANIGSILTSNIGQRMAEELDDVTVNGNGTNTLEGLLEASGVTTVSKSGGAGTAWLVDDLENLLFTLPKQYRNKALQPCWVMNDTTYGRLRGIPVGAADARRVFGMDHNVYSLLDWPVRIQNDIPNATIAFGALQKYRAYRRQGMSVEWTREGRTLALSNLALLIARGRHGGRLVDTNALAKITTGQA